MILYLTLRLVWPAIAVLQADDVLRARLVRYTLGERYLRRVEA